MSRFSKKYFVSCSLVLYALFVLPDVIYTLKISLYSIYDLFWHEDNLFLYFLAFHSVRFFSIKCSTQSLSLLSHLDPKFISPPKYLYMLDVYALFSKFVGGLLCSKVVFQRTNSVPFLNTIISHHYKNLSESILSTKWFDMVSILSIWASRIISKS